VDCLWDDAPQDGAREVGIEAPAGFRGGLQKPYSKKKMVIPSAVTALRLKHGCRFCSLSLGRFRHEVAYWKYQDIVVASEAKKKVKG
jgi:hypothetical protein